MLGYHTKLGLGGVLSVCVNVILVAKLFFQDDRRKVHDISIFK